MVKFHERKGLSWCKLHNGWFGCESHADIHAGLLGVGALMMSIANRFGRQPDGSGLVVSKTGKALTATQIAHRGRCPEEYVNEALAALVEAETIEITSDGVIVFPNLQRWQEDPSTERKRKGRGSKREIHAESPREIHADSHAGRPPLECEIHASEDQRIRGSEDQKIRRSDPPYSPPAGDGLFTLESSPVAVREPKRRKGPPKKKEDRAAWFLGEAKRLGRVADVDAVCSAYVAEHKRIRPRSRPKPGPTERGLIAERLIADDPRYTVTDITEAIRGCHADRWHVDAGKLELEYIVRDSAHVEKFRRKFEAAQDSVTGTTGDPVVRMDPVRLGYAEQLDLRNEKLRQEAQARRAQTQQGSAGPWEEGGKVIDVSSRRSLGDGGGRAA